MDLVGIAKRASECKTHTRPPGHMYCEDGPLLLLVPLPLIPVIQAKPPISMRNHDKT
jgi:hypothetical protein